MRASHKGDFRIPSLPRSNVNTFPSFLMLEERLLFIHFLIILFRSSKIVDFLPIALIWYI